MGKSDDKLERSLWNRRFFGQVESEQILNYLVTNAGSGKITANNNTMQITKSPYFIKEHRKITPNLIEQKEVGSLANCMAC